MDANAKPSPKTGWVEIRDAAGKLLFRYDPFENVVQVKRDKHVQVVELDQIRSKFGVSVPPARQEVIIGKFVAESGEGNYV